MLKEIVLKHVLKNAFDYGKASVGGVVGKVIAEFPGAKKDMKSTLQLINKTIAEVNKFSKAKIEMQMQSHEYVEKKQEEKKLELSNVTGKVVTRFLPEPNGYAHIGHAKAAFLSMQCAAEYDGEFFVRWDDTNPEVEKSEYVDAIRSDLKWLGLEFKNEFYTSDFVPVFYEKAEQLMNQGDAYVCQCGKEQVAKTREEQKPCKCRGNSKNQNLDLWNKMLRGEIGEGKAIVRLVGNLSALNTVMRDPTLLRVLKTPHYRCGAKYNVWPNYDFAVSIADSLQGVTHALRSKEYELRDELYYYILDKLQMRKPVVYDFARLNLQGTKLSKRFLLPLIKQKKVGGWDDPRLPTLSGLRRRGFLPEAIKKFVLSFGLSKVESKPTWDKLLAENRKLLETFAKHFFFVSNPVKLKIIGIAAENSREEAAKRNFEQVKDTSCVYLPESQFLSSEEVRLKGFCSVKVNKNELEIVEGMPTKKLQWVFAENAVKTKLLVVKDLMVNGEFNKNSLETVNGVCPQSILSLKEGDFVQFERVGFARLDQKTKSSTIFIFSC